MKKFSAIFFLVFFTVVSFQHVSLRVLYELNKDFISKTFCVNKEKPALKCNGKCHLKDQIAKATSEKEENKNNSEIQIMLAVFISDVNLGLPQLTLNASTHRNRVIVLKNSHCYSFLDPPRFV